MNQTWIYLLQVNVGIVFFYLFYRLFFASDTFWRTRRIYLLASIGASFIYPVLSIQNWLSQPEPVQTTLVRISTLPEIIISPAQETSSYSLEGIILFVYLTVSAGLFFHLIWQQIDILRIRYSGKRMMIQETEVISVDQKISPFSYFGDIFINPALHNEHETREILTHESAHVRQMHSIDVVLLELLKVAFWINPAVWLLKREVRQNLEFLADSKVLKEGFDSKKYQYHLLQLSFQSPDIQIGNQFNVSPLKKRIIMMNKKNSNKTALLKYALIVPLVLALIITANAREVVQNASKMTSGAKQVIVKAKSESKSEIQSPLKEDIIIVNTDDKKTDEVFQVVEKMPEYIGGQNALYTFLAQNIRYPVAAVEANVEAVVLIRFIVNKEGQVVNPEVMKTMEVKSNNYKIKAGEVTVVGYAVNDSVNKIKYDQGLKALEKEGLRVVGMMNNWIPGEQKGEKVSVYYVIPINFKLNGKDKKQNISNETGVSAPIYLIDDKPASKSEVDAIKPEDIQSVSVLKDESATKIYGEKGKNGVVILKIKKK